MGKIKQGILGGFNGKTGSVVGASWKGIAYMRGKAQSIKNPRTASQQFNRTLFGKISDIMSKAKDAVNVGFIGKALKKSAFNAAVQANMKFFTETEDDYNTANLVFSDGNMLPLTSGGITISGRSVTISADTVVAYADGLNYDVVYVVEGEFPGAPFVKVKGGLSMAPSTSITDTFEVPAGISFSKVHGFVFGYDTDIRDATLTTYCGEVTPA